MNADLNKILKAVTGRKWRKRGTWYHTPMFDEIFNEGESTKYAKALGYPFKRTLGVWLPNCDYLDLQDEWDAMTQSIRDAYKKDPLYLEKYAEHCLLMAEEILKFSRKLQTKDATDMSDVELVDTHVSIITKHKEFMPFMMSVHTVDEIVTERFDTLLKAFISEKKLSKQEFFRYQAALTFPYRKIFVLQEREDLMKLAVRVKKEKLKTKDKTIQELLKNHRNEYAWINAAQLEKLPYTVADFEKRLDDLLLTDVEAEYESTRKHEEMLKAEQKECMKAISSHEELAEISKVIQIFGFLRSYRIDVVYKALFMTFNITTEVAKRLGIEFIDIKYLDTENVRTGLLDPKNLDYRKLIEERKAGLLSVTIGDTRYELTGKDIEPVAKLIRLEEEKATGIVKGSTAYPGKITGPCKVLFSLEDMKKIKKGDILVISMTDPNYIPAMDKASAFVTDQGGILCHAAIVSREMKKPCIIGTKIATKSFKDGDVLEVDADAGIVTVIK